MRLVSAKSTDMTEGVIWKKIIVFAVPLIIGDLLQQLYSTADSIIVGRFVGKTALAAVGATETVINTFLGLFIGVSQGATIAISQAFGAKDGERVHRCVHTTVAFSVILAAVLTAAGLLAVPLMLRLLATPDDVYAEARQYLGIYFGGIVCPILYNLLGGILRAVGDAERPLYALILCSIFNIILDLLFVAVFHWGVAGAAVATVLSQLISAVYLLFLLLKTDEEYRLDVKKVRIDGVSLRKIVSIGLPIGVQRTLVAFSNTLVVSRINSFGSGAMAAWGVYRRLDQAVTNMFQSISVAIASFIGQNFGAKKIDRMKKGYRTALLMDMLIAVVFAGLIILLRRPLISLFSSDPEVMAYGSIIVVTSMSLQWVNSFASTRAGFLRGIGDSRGPMIIMMLSYIFLRQAFLYIGWPHFAGVAFATVSYPFGWICSSVMLEIYTRVKYRGFETAGGEYA